MLLILLMANDNNKKKGLYKNNTFSKNFTSLFYFLEMNWSQ